ncbi:MAG: hypothetical protein J5725_03625 [Bacteroidales bacterium]|nr:hypothetical protein [Bacteroidales bacterium]
MPKIKINDVDNYNVVETAGFFSLKDDHDTAVVRFMYETDDDIELDVVHEIEVDGKPRNVNCLRSYDDPIDDCPLCRAGNRPKVKMFVPVFVMGKDGKGEVKIWQRGKTFAKQLTSMCARYNPLVSTPIEIERQGKKGDQTTKYQLYPHQSDDVTLDDLPEVPSPIGTIILDKSYEELEYYLENGAFKGQQITERTTTEPPVKRRRAF